MWLLPKLQDKKINGSPDIEVYGSVKAVDGGVHLDGKESYLKVGSFNQRCLHDPSKCSDGLSLSCKLKFNRVSIVINEPNWGTFQKFPKTWKAFFFIIFGCKLLSIKIISLSCQQE